MSERKRDYPSGAEKRKSKRKREEVIKKVPKISSFFQRQDTVSDLDWKGKYYPPIYSGSVVINKEIF